MIDLYISEDANDNKCASTVVLIKKLPTSYLRSLQIICKILWVARLIVVPASPLHSTQSCPKRPWEGVPLFIGSASSLEAYLKSGLFSFFFQAEQYFSLITFQPEQCFPATFSQVSASRKGLLGHHSIVYSFFFFIRICIKVSSFVASPHPKSQGK